MGHIELIISIIEENLKIFEEDLDDDKLLKPDADIILHLSLRTCEVGFRPKPIDGLCFEVLPIPVKTNKKKYIDDLVSALTKFAILNLRVSVKLHEFNDEVEEIFNSKSCATLQEKVEDFTGLHRKEFLRIAFSHDNCNVEIFFYTSAKFRENLFFSAGHFNPMATNELVIKLITSAENYSVLEMVGFIGVLSTEKFSTVQECVQLAYKKIVKCVEQIEQRHLEAKQVNNWDDFEVIEYCFKSQECSLKVKPEKDTESRWNMRSRSKASRCEDGFVDLTNAEEEKNDDKRFDDTSVSDESFFSAVCSDTFGSPFDDCNETSNLFHKGWDERKEPAQLYKNKNLCDSRLFNWLRSDHVKAQDYYEVGDHLSPSQKENELKQIEREMKERRLQNSLEATTSEELRMSESMSALNLESKKSTAENYYNRKASRDYSQAPIQSTSEDTRRNKIAKSDTRKHPHKLNKDIGLSIVPTKKSRLLDDVDCERYSEKKSRITSINCFDPEETEKQKLILNSFTIPKLQSKSTDRQESKSPFSVTSRPPIHENFLSSSRGEPANIARISRIMDKCKKDPSNMLRSPDGYDPRNFAVPMGSSSSRNERFSSNNESSLFAIGDFMSSTRNDEVINVDDDDDPVDLIPDDENSDTNNNTNSKRKLLALNSPVLPNKRPNKIFLTKKDRPPSKAKPDFSKQK